MLAIATKSLPYQPHEPHQPHEPVLRRELRKQLLALPYRAFLQVIIHLLTRQGYSMARPAGRAHWKGRNQGGGWDAEADFAAGAVGTLRCLVQVKQYATLTVQQRQVDELRGSCLRAGAQQALLVTLSAFSPVAQQAAEAAAYALPMRLIDGDGLLTLLMENGLGIRRDKAGQRHIDEFYFHALRERFGKDKTAQGKPERKLPPEKDQKPVSLSRPSVTVIVRLARHEGVEDRFCRL